MRNYTHYQKLFTDIDTHVPVATVARTLKTALMSHCILCITFNRVFPGSK